ncbi:MAG: glutamyl-tRNA reductase [Candidatus Omnitrophota bacterium]|jgi:glutamyl-tRNA reductase
MGFFVVGVNHKVCPVSIREQIFFGASELQKAFTAVRTYPDIAELFILSTCNRVELYGFSERAELPAESLTRLLEEVHDVARSQFEGYLYRYEGREAMKHLFRVSAGLDSLVIGEDEILGQLRDAFRLASEAGSIHSLLYRLIEKALKVGKDVRTRTRINEGAVSVPSVVAELARKIFGHLKDCKVVVLGSGEMSTLTLKCLKDAGAGKLSIVSRTRDKGELLARQFGATWIPFDGWEQEMPTTDILVTSTACPHPIVQPHQVKTAFEVRGHRPLFLIDIAVPRNIASEVNLLEDVHLYNIDDLKGVADSNLRNREKEIQAAEVILDKAVSDYEAWLDQLKARPTMERFEKFLAEVLAKELGPLARRPGADPAEAERLSERICAKLTHAPYEKLKEASRSGGASRYLEAIQTLFGLDAPDSPEDPS